MNLGLIVLTLVIQVPDTLSTELQAIIDSAVETLTPLISGEVCLNDAGALPPGTFPVPQDDLPFSCKRLVERMERDGVDSPTVDSGILSLYEFIQGSLMGNVERAREIKALWAQRAESELRTGFYTDDEAILKRVQLGTYYAGEEDWEGAVQHLDAMDRRPPPGIEVDPPPWVIRRMASLGPRWRFASRGESIVVAVSLDRQRRTPEGVLTWVTSRLAQERSSGGTIFDEIRSLEEFDCVRERVRTVELRLMLANEFVERLSDDTGEWRHVAPGEVLERAMALACEAR
jgi:hypothetical protein